MDEAQLRKLVRSLSSLSRRVRSDGPQTDDELHKWIEDNLGVSIPRVAVCEDHQAPFSFIADVYFERLSVEVLGESLPVNGALVLANRGGSKTFDVAIIHFLNATFKPGCEGLQFGATEKQGNRCYENIEEWCYHHDKETGRRTEDVQDFILDKPMRSETKWKTGSKVEVVAGSEKAVSGPHPQKAGADEVDQMERNVWNQSRGMAVASKATGPLPKFMHRVKPSGELVDDRVIPPQDIVTSTRNSRHGLMQELLEELEEDITNGNIPQFSKFVWCIWETVAEVPQCQCILAEKRKARLRELERDEDELCPCHRVVKGRNKDGTPRTLKDACAGKAFRSRGWKPLVDLISTFKRNTPGSWTLQHECREGVDDNNYIQNWSLDSYGLRNYEPRPEYGKIYQGIDWGGTNPHCVLWIQHLTTDVPAYDNDYNPIFLSAGTYVLFKEIYVTGIDTAKLAMQVQQIENAYRVQYGRRWKVHGRFMDPQGVADRLHFARMGMGGAWPVKTRQKETMITQVQNLVMDDRFAVDSDGAPMFCEEVESWQQDEKKPGKELDTFNHSMAAWRYCIANAEIVEGKRPNTHTNTGSTKKHRNVTPSPYSTPGADRGVKKVGPVALSGTSRRHATDQFQTP